MTMMAQINPANVVWKFNAKFLIIFPAKLWNLNIFTLYLSGDNFRGEQS